MHRRYMAWELQVMFNPVALRKEGPEGRVCADTEAEQRFGEFSEGIASLLVILGVSTTIVLLLSGSSSLSAHSTWSTTTYMN